MWVVMTDLPPRGLDDLAVVALEELPGGRVALGHVGLGGG